MKGLLDRLFKNIGKDDKSLKSKDMTDLTISSSLFDRILLYDYR